MSTSAQIRFATRESGQSFNQHASAIHAQFYVHYDGYPEGLGVNIAESLLNGSKIDLEIQSLTASHQDLEYIYYVWQAVDKSTFISIFEVGSFAGHCKHCEQDLPTAEDRCIFVGTPTELINKYEYNDR